MIALDGDFSDDYAEDDMNLECTRRSDFALFSRFGKAALILKLTTDRMSIEI